MRAMTGMLALAASAGLASAQFTVLIPAATASDGATINQTYTGSNTIFSTLAFVGDLTEINTSTFASEADWTITNNSFGGGTTFNPTTTTGFTGTINVSNTLGGLFWANNGDDFQFDSFESFDDGGDAVADAQWDNASFEFSGSTTVTDLGQLSSSFALDTDNVGNTDTELALYTIDGTLIDSNDDNLANGGPGGLWSLLNVSLATDTTYLIVVGGFNSQFGDAVALTGTATGDFNVNVNGNTLATGTLQGGDFHVFSFTIPAPGSAALLAMGGLVAARRRR